jgi:hypothetical protein
MIDTIGYRRVTSSFIVPRIPQNKRGEASNGSMKTKHKINSMTVNFLIALPMDVKLLFPMKLAEIVAIPFDKLSQIKTINT